MRAKDRSSLSWTAAALGLILNPSALAEPFPMAAATITHPGVPEMSGLVQSRTYPGVFWVHNDSGNEPILYAVHADGRVIMPSWVSKEFFVDKPEKGKKEYPGIHVDVAANVDWEDIALDEGLIYIADLGNNGNARRDLGIYVVPEPNPEATMQIRPLKWLPVIYPDQKEFPGKVWHYDCEAIFFFHHKLYALTKHRADGQYNKPEDSTDLYRLDTAFTDKPNILVKIESRAGLGGWVTGADLSPDGKTLAVLCEGPVRGLWLFQSKDGGEKFLSGNARHLLLPDARQCEAVAFVDENNLLVGNEQRDLFRIPLSVFP